MSGPIRSAVIAAAVIPDTTLVTLLTVPSGITYIVKDLMVYNAAAAAQPASVFAVHGNGAAGYFCNGSINSGATVHVVAYTVLGPGDKLLCGVGTGNVHVWVSGTRLTGTAPFP